MREDPKALFRRKVFQARKFAESSMVCPGCHIAIPEPVDECPRCGFSGRGVVEKFAFEAPDLDRYIDPVGFLAEESREKIDRVLDELEEDFPQIRVSICIIDLLPDTDPREFGFWMFNASKVRNEAEAARRPWTILLTIDDRNARASVTVGYAIEPFVKDDAWEWMLRMDRKLFLEKDYEAGVLKFVEGVDQVLAEGAVRVDKKLARIRKEKRGREAWQ